MRWRHRLVLHPAGVGGQPVGGWAPLTALQTNASPRVTLNLWLQMWVLEGSCTAVYFMGKIIYALGVPRLRITGFMVPSYFLTLTSSQQKSFYFPLDLIHHGTFVSKGNVAVAWNAFHLTIKGNLQDRMANHPISSFPSYSVSCWSATFSAHSFWKSQHVAFIMLLPISRGPSDYWTKSSFSCLPWRPAAVFLVISSHLVPSF